MSKTFFVYILSNSRNTTFYIGVTSNLLERVLQHKSRAVKSFTSKYNIEKLVYYGEINNPLDAIKREKQLKNWHRDWKLNLIKRINPELIDLAENWYERDPETSSG